MEAFLPLALERKVNSVIIPTFINTSLARYVACNYYVRCLIVKRAVI
jgi:hypothetical protein